jgi:hypothetical protein
MNHSFYSDKKNSLKLTSELESEEEVFDLFEFL